MKKSVFHCLILIAFLALGLAPQLALENRIIRPPIYPAPAPIRPTPKYPDAKIHLPILMYHYIRNLTAVKDTLGQRLSVSPQNFEKQLQWLKTHHYQTVNPDYLLRPTPLTGLPIIITLDDGYRDAYENALPLLIKYGFTATFYVLVNGLNKPAYLTWDEVIELKKAGMNIGSHTLHHPNLPTLTTENLTFEIRESKRILDERLNQNTTDFCYPYGAYDHRALQAVNQAGYLTATSTKTDEATEKHSAFELPRLRVFDDTDLNILLTN